MRKLNEEQWQSLASTMERAMARVVPDWASHNTHDPGITVLELLSYALTDLQYRSETIDANGRALARHVAQLAGSLAGATGTDADCPPGAQRVNYFHGKLLDVDDFTTEQAYFLRKIHRLNRMVHGSGVATGLSVTLERTGNSAQVIIAPGLAFNPRGEEIDVCAPTSLLLPALGKSLLVLLHYAEQPCRPVPAPDPQADLQARFSRITETFSATLAPATDDTAVALARVNFSRGRWMLDRKFKPAKVKA